MKTYTIQKLLGSKVEHIEEVKVAVLMFITTLLYVGVSKQFVADYHFNVYEFTGTWTGLVCVWLSRTRNVLCWPWGIVSSVLLGIFFARIGLPGQQWLNWGYFVVIQLWAWPHWVYGGKDKDELPVRSLSILGKFYTITAVFGGTVVVYYLIDVFVPGSLYPQLDALVVASSVVAQFLLGRKKVESWILWAGPVNLVSIVLFYMSGAYTLTALYVAFFVHAVFALNSWRKVNNNTEIYV
jgi:nicotinamide mononucleotide transporter